jgi:hypothetical protein
MLGADDNIYDAVREACHLGRANVRFVERRERKWDLRVRVLVLKGDDSIARVSALHEEQPT